MAKKDNNTFYGTGRRKNAVARVRIIPGKGNIEVNGMSLDDYMPTDVAKIIVKQPLVVTGTEGKYDEDSFPDAKSFYGRSKALGEVRNDKNVTLRTSIVGPDTNPKGIGLFQWFMNQEGQVGGYSKVIWTGVTTIELAKQIEVAINNKLTGLQHVVNNDFIPKKDLLELFKKHFNKDIKIEINDKVVSEKTLVRTDKSYSFDVPSYDQMVKEMQEWVINHPEIYSDIESEIDKNESNDNSRNKTRNN